MYRISDLNILIKSEDSNFLFNDTHYSNFYIPDINNHDLVLSLKFLKTDIAKVTTISLRNKNYKKENILLETRNCYDISYEERNNCIMVNKLSCYAYSDINNELSVFSYDTKRPYINLNVPMMFLLANGILSKNGLLIHGAAGIIEGKAFGIIGIPGAGKSTAIEIINHDFLLSDDVFMIRVENGVPMAYSSPLGPNTDGQCKIQLNTLFLPVKSDHFELKRIYGLDSIAKFYLSQAGYWNKVFKPHRKNYFNIIKKILSKVKVYEMLFKQNYIDNEQMHKEILNS